MSSIKRGDWIKYTVSYWEGDTRKTNTVLAQVLSSRKDKGLGTVTGMSGMRYDFNQDGTSKGMAAGLHSTAVLVSEEEKAKHELGPNLFCVVIKGSGT